MLPLHNTAICLSLWAVQCFLRFPQRLILYQIHSQLSIGFLKKVENFAAQGLPYPFPASESGVGADTACVIVARYASIGVRPHNTRVVCRHSGNTDCRLLPVLKTIYSRFSAQKRDGLCVLSPTWRRVTAHRQIRAIHPQRRFP